MSEGENWLKLRSMGIGGSDAASVMGINPYKSKLQLWHEKVNQVITDHSENLRLKLGKVLEPIIADEYIQKTGRKLEIVPMKVHPMHDFIIGNIDRRIIGDERGPGILEMKTKGSWVNWHGEDIPIYYKIQLQHYLSIFGYKWGSFGLFDLGTQKLTIIDEERDDNLIKELIKEETNFWDMVKYKIPPQPDNTKACENFLREHYKESEDRIIDLSENDEATKWALLLTRAKNEIKLAQNVEIEARNHLMSIVGNAQKATGKWFNITWKAPKDREIFDIDKFKIDHPQLAKEYMTYQPQMRRFTFRSR